MSQTISPRPSCGEKPSVCQAFSMSAIRGARGRGSGHGESALLRGAHGEGADDLGRLHAEAEPEVHDLADRPLAQGQEDAAHDVLRMDEVPRGVVREEDLLVREDCLERVLRESRGPSAWPRGGEDAQDHEGQAGGEERLLLGGLREEIAVLSGLDGLVLARAEVRFVARAVERRVGEVDEEADTRPAGRLGERPEARGVEGEAHRVHDGGGPVLGEDGLEELRVRPVAAHDRNAWVAPERGEPLLLEGAAVARVVERVEDDDALARAEELARDGGAEEARAARDEDEAHGVGVGAGAF